MPCVLTMLTDPTIQEPYALVSMDPGAFEHTSCCKVAEVEGRIKILTEEHAQGEEFISRKALFVRVVRPSGPQLSLIDLPGVTHNAEKMKDIHEVTVRLVEEYIKPQEMVILCVIPAMSDFGNAEVIKLARKFDPAGQRTLGVVTKCDDAAKAEASDIVEKVLMTRDSDVRLALGFHCVVNRSQKNIDEGMSRTELWQKEEKVFKGSERLRSLPLENWGTSRLMEKIASIQEARVDECLPKIKVEGLAAAETGSFVETPLTEGCPSEADQFRLFNSILVKISADLERRVRAEYIGTEDCDRDLAIAPKVARMVDAFRKELFAANPEWLGQEMINEVTDTVETFVHGYTVGNLTGPQVFINLIKRIFVEDGLLQREVTDLIERVAEHLGQVVHHLIEQHADLNNVFAARLSMKADEVIDQLTAKATGLCDALARAQAVTSTTHGAYMVKLTQFRKSWLREGAERLQQGAERLQEVAERVRRVLTPEFVDLVQAAQTEPQKLAILEICASLHVYTGFMIEGQGDGGGVWRERLYLTTVSVSCWRVYGTFSH
ncbi:unnamed protein product [Effrenium voratum]|nr:unnamed protein product [Effrenium voratum]